jgi:putative ABC transport system substrate-binding protein
VRRREFLKLLGGAAAAWPLGARAQQKIPRVGFMGNSTAALEGNLVNSFRDGMRDLGYEEGRNIVIDYLWAEGKYERFPALVAEFIAAKVDVIVTAGTPAALAVKGKTTTVPLVMVAVGDPVGTGLVQNLARPGGNLTGLSSIAPDLEGKRLQLLREVVPHAFARRRVFQFAQSVSRYVGASGGYRCADTGHQTATARHTHLRRPRRRLRRNSQGAAGRAFHSGGPGVSA